ncbi:MAG: hypothetical protein RBS39_12855 [Phycisphaerales bacterium]|jgi:hypothetical protein|nr:hypothetical protein [Phycisphaerales bacterium]
MAHARTRTSSTHLPRVRRAPHALLAACLGVAACGCASAPPTPVDYARAFPGQLVQRETLDIHAFQHPTTLEFTNTTARAFGPTTIWINRWYSAPVESIEVGETISIPLKRFRDAESFAFRAGGFFASREPDTVTQAQLEVTRPDGTRELLGLIVIGEREDLRIGDL